MSLERQQSDNRRVPDPHVTVWSEVGGIELRYLLTTYLFDHGQATVDELVDALAYQGFRVSGRARRVLRISQPSNRSAAPSRRG